MIHLTRSHNLNTLSGALAEKLMETAPDDPFVPQKIIVPNQDTARWFKLFAAEKNGIAANLECTLPAEWLWKQIRKLYPDLPELLPSDLQPMKWSLFQLLSDDNQREKFERLDRYVRNQQPEERRQQSLFQMAGQIASVFDEYLVYRPEMMLRWQRGKTGKGDEKWQAELWRLLNRSWKKSGGDGKQKNRAELYNEVRTALSNRQLETDDSTYVLNPGLLPIPIIKMLKKIGSQSEVFVYQIQVSKQLKRNKNEIVQLFGRESEMINEVINVLEPDRATNLYPEIPQNRPLNQIQSDILNGDFIRKISKKDNGIEGIEIRSCHSPLREIEVLYQFLLEKLEEDETLHPDDILIATPDLETYRPYIKAVFECGDEGLPEIPYHAGYSNKTSETGIERTLLRLLNVIDSRFEFSSVMDLFMMPPFFQRYGISESDVHKLKRWMKENYVIWGMDSEHRKEFDQPEEQLQTWNSALQRGWKGHLLGGERGGAADGILLFQSIRSVNDQQTWAAFSHYLNRLDAMQKELKRKQTCFGWCDWLLSHMNSLFDHSLLVGMEAQGILRLIDNIREQSEVAECDEFVSFSIFKSELTSMLDQHRASGALFTNGVTFSSMVPVRSIPFKVIALIGLNADTFPRKQIAPDFDLMAQNPLPGERNRKNEDRNLFLESIMAADDIHYCSYIGQSKVDNEEIPPSTIIHEWVDLLSHASGLDEKDIIKKEALSGFSPANFASNRSYSKTYFETACHLLDDKDTISGLKLEYSIPMEDTEEPIQVNDLIRFYSNPIQWFLRKRFEVSLREPDQEKDEFNLDHLEYHLLFQRVFGWVLNGMPDQQIRKYLVDSGSVPAGWVGERRVHDLKKNVQIAIAAMKSHELSPREVHTDISLRVGEREIEGSFISYSVDQFIDVNPSGMSGKAALKSWIQHVCAQADNVFKEKSSVLFCDLKKGEPKRQVFKPVENPESILKGLIDLYQQGLTEPQHFFPKTLFAFEERERDGKEDAYKKAASAFEGGWHRGEKEDRFIQTVLGSEISFQNDFITDRYRQIIGQMMDHMEEV